MATPAQSAFSKEELLKKLKEGQASWNQWKASQDTVPDMTAVRDVDLKEIDLSKFNLGNVDLAGYQLNGVNLRGAKLAHANLSKCNLSGAKLGSADLTGADLRGADLSKAELVGTRMGPGTLVRKAIIAGANLYKANLTGANLQEVDFKDVKILRAQFRGALLRGSDLASTQPGLLASQLAGTDLTGAKLPEAIVKSYEALGSVSEISDSAKKLFLVLLAGCLYCWLTIGTTKDVDLITNRASSPLPIIQTAIPVVGFYVVAPLILLCIYFYFHFYLQKLWEELASLPAVFPDGRPLYARADPWLFNDLVRGHFSRLKGSRPFLSYFQQWISILLAWWIVPFTLFLFWGRYFPRHDVFWTVVLAIVLAISTVSAIRLYHLARSTLRGDRRLSLAETVRSRNPYVNVLLLCGFAATFIVISLGAIFEIPLWVPTPHSSLRTWVPLATNWVNYSPFAYLRDADLSIKPLDWTGKKDDELDRVKGVDLHKRDFRYAYAPHSFFVKAGLSKSDFSHAFLPEADLRQADLYGATLSEANLESARMEGAQVLNVRWAGARIRFADLRNVKPRLDLNEITKCKDWQLAFYDGDVLQQLGLPPDHNDALNQYRKSEATETFDSWVLKWRQEKNRRHPS